MNKGIILAVGVTFTISSCVSYAASGAYTGSTLGSILGSAIGGITGGPRGSDIGTIVGMAGGAIIGEAIGATADRQRIDDLDRYQRDKEQRAYERQQRQQDQQNQFQQDNRSNDYQQPQQGQPESGFDATNSGDDRLYDFNGKDYTGNYSAQPPVTQLPQSSSIDDLAKGLDYAPNIEIKNARFVDNNQDNVISRNEICKVIFEIYNRGQRTLFDIQPAVLDASGNRNLYISPGMHIEKLEPNAGIRYTAVIKANDKLKDGVAKICLSVIQGNKSISKVSEFNIPTRKN